MFPTSNNRLNDFGEELLMINPKRELKEIRDDQILVQYFETENQLTQEIVHKTEISLLSDQAPFQTFVKVGKCRFGTLLHEHDDRDYMLKVLVELKGQCFDHAFDDTFAPLSDINDETWLLVQYSPKPEMVIYDVINYSETLWHEQNMYKDVIAYIRHSELIVLKAVVIAYSQNKVAMELKLSDLRRFCLFLNFPEPFEIDANMNQTARIYQRSTIFMQAEEKDTSGIYRRLRNGLEQLTQDMALEANSLLEAYRWLSDVGLSVQQRITDSKQFLFVPKMSDYS